MRHQLGYPYQQTRCQRHLHHPAPLGVVQPAGGVAEAEHQVLAAVRVRGERAARGDDAEFVGGVRGPLGRGLGVTHQVVGELALVDEPQQLLAGRTVRGLRAQLPGAVPVREQHPAVRPQPVELRPGRKPPGEPFEFPQPRSYGHRPPHPHLDPCHVTPGDAGRRAAGSRRPGPTFRILRTRGDIAQGRAEPTDGGNRPGR